MGVDNKKILGSFRLSEKLTNFSCKDSLYQRNLPGSKRSKTANIAYHHGPTPAESQRQFPSNSKEKKVLFQSLSGSKEGRQSEVHHGPFMVKHLPEIARFQNADPPDPVSPSESKSSDGHPNLKDA